MYVDHSGGTERTDTQNCPCNTLLYGFRLRLTCPVGHNGLLSILGGSARPPSLLTLPPVEGSRGILQHLLYTESESPLLQNWVV